MFNTLKNCRKTAYIFHKPWSSHELLKPHACIKHTHIHTCTHQRSWHHGLHFSLSFSEIWVQSNLGSNFDTCQTGFWSPHAVCICKCLTWETTLRRSLNSVTMWTRHLLYWLKHSTHFGHNDSKQMMNTLSCGLRSTQCRCMSDNYIISYRLVITEHKRLISSIFHTHNNYIWIT